VFLLIETFDLAKREIWRAARQQVHRASGGDLRNYAREAQPVHAGLSKGILSDHMPQHTAGRRGLVTYVTSASLR